MSKSQKSSFHDENSQVLLLKSFHEEKSQEHSPQINELIEQLDLNIVSDESKKTNI